MRFDRDGGGVCCLGQTIGFVEEVKEDRDSSGYLWRRAVASGISQFFIAAPMTVRRIYVQEKSRSVF